MLFENWPWRMLLMCFGTPIPDYRNDHRYRVADNQAQSPRFRYVRILVDNPQTFLNHTMRSSTGSIEFETQRDMSIHINQAQALNIETNWVSHGLPYIAIRRIHFARTRQSCTKSLQSQHHLRQIRTMLNWTNSTRYATGNTTEKSAQTDAKAEYNHTT